MPGFGRSKGPVANQLSTQAVPNTLSWPTAHVVEPKPELPVTYDLDLASEDVEGVAEGPLGNAGDDADYADGSSVLTPAELREELDQQAEEFGLTNIPIERYGPHGEDVEAVMIALDDIRFEDITSDDLRRLEDVWKAVDPEASAAVLAVVDPFRIRGEHVEFLEAAEMDLAAWQSTRLATGQEAELDRVVVEAARDAVDALILQDELDDEEFDVLYGPWAEVIDPIEEKGFAATKEPAGEQGSEASDSATPDEGFGPNAPAVRAFLTTLSELGWDDFKDLTAAFNRQPKDDLQMAHDAVHEVVDADPI